MKSILILGAGLSASSLIRYLLKHAEAENWYLKVVDRNPEMVREKLNGSKYAEALGFNALDPIERRPEIEKADLVISMLPARFHVEIAKDCIEFRKNLITPSYVSEEMRGLDIAARDAEIIILNEIGVDPGIDHMSAMQVLDEIRSKNGKMHSFKSFCGGLIAPESDNNPWNYKFTWNPRNVVLAGQGSAACFIEENEYKYIPYNRLFGRLDTIEIPDVGVFEGYANRDSLSYRKTYGLEGIPTIYRGTLRKQGYCESWNVFVSLGMTDDSYKMDQSHKLTKRSFLNAFLPFNPNATVEEKFLKYVHGDKNIFKKFEWLGLFEKEEELKIVDASPAQLLEAILKEKWTLDPKDKDMLLMYHEFTYDDESETRHRITSHMVSIGENQTYTAMSNTVGLPVAIAAKMILKGEIQDTGVILPIAKHIYEPILKELDDLGIRFKEHHEIIGGNL